MRARLDPRALPPLLFLAAAAGACRPATGIAVAVDLPAEWRDANDSSRQITSVRVDVSVEGRTMTTTSGQAFPMKFELVTGAPADADVELTATGLRADGSSATTQRVHTRFDTGHWHLLRFALGCCPDPAGCPTIDTPASRLPPLTGDVTANDDAAEDVCTRDRPLPDDTNTGPAHTPTRSCDATMSTEGAVLDGCDFAQCVTITANNVVLRNSHVRCDGATAIQVGGVGATVTGVVIEDVEVDGSMSNGEQWGIGGDGVTVLRAKVHDVARGVVVGSHGLVQDSWIHHLTSASQHGVYAGDGTDMSVVHNHIELDAVPGACVTFATDNGPIDRVLIEGNTLDGGSNVIELTGTSAPQNVAIYHNRFGTSQINGFLNRASGATVDWKYNVDATGAAITDP